MSLLGSMLSDLDEKSVNESYMRVSRSPPDSPGPCTKARKLIKWDFKISRNTNYRVSNFERNLQIVGGLPLLTTTVLLFSFSYFSVKKSVSRPQEVSPRVTSRCRIWIWSPNWCRTGSRTSNWRDYENSKIGKEQKIHEIRFPDLRRCPRGGFRAEESEFAVQNDLGQAPGPQNDEIMRFQFIWKFTKNI